MSVPGATLHPMTTHERITRLIELRARADTSGQIDYLDELMTASALWTQRPGEIDRIADVLDTLIARATP